ncbi:MAG: DNA adenine methyltransferase YhdJ [Verrucomicrobia subdivision 3 bacterium]|nr:DNA adenine methyltransferase YhdJ [Limisphaerales bacterium]MCS1417697.1 DNA adenine methyltransferase YhdJ [Limisphaerales bacterium]
MDEKPRAPRNRTLTLNKEEYATLAERLLRLNTPTTPAEIVGRTICQDLFEALPHLPSRFIDLLIVDPPYNINKSFNGSAFKSRPAEHYAEWVDSWLNPLCRVLKPTASIYICCDWRCSAAVQQVGERYFTVQNRITWEREKGRGALQNWKNCSEDIWFFTASREYTFNVDAVKLKRRVIAPYTAEDGTPKDWNETNRGGFRLTHPSNLWTDISVPFWSMPENTDHPTQKPEKFVAKLILASSNPGDMILDPFLGSGTTSVVAKKLGRSYVGIEVDEMYCCLAEKRLGRADHDDSVQGYQDGVFWERNSLADQHRSAMRRLTQSAQHQRLFEVD